MSSFGIDFGTTNSVVAMHGPSGIEVLAIDAPPADWAMLGFDRVMPTVFAPSGGGAIFGWQAKQAAIRVEAVKRLLAEETTVDVGGRALDIDQITQHLFEHLKSSVSRAGLTLSRAVVTIPANSRGKPRLRTKQCAIGAGITVPAIINEPTAAAMAYCYRNPGDRNLLVVDWGGGTLDVTIIEAIDGTFVEQASKGVQMLGGIDFDQRFRAALAKELPQLEHWSESEKAAFWLELERAKVLLSSYESTTVTLPTGEVMTVERSLFENAVSSLIQRVAMPIEQCMSDVGASSSQFDAVVLVGGTCRIPAVRQFVNQLLGVETDTSIDPMTAVAEGAAVAAAILADEVDADFVVSTEHALGTIATDPDTSTEVFSALIPRNHKLPAESSQTFFPAIEGQEVINVRVIEGDPDQPLDHPDNVIVRNWILSIPSDRSLDQAAFEVHYSYDVDGILHVEVIDPHGNQVLLHDRVSFMPADPASNPTASAPLGGPTAPLTQPQPAVSPATFAPPGIIEQPVTTGYDILLQDARSKVIPFVEDDEAAALRALVRRVERSDTDNGQALAELNAALQRYAHLL